MAGQRKLYIVVDVADFEAVRKLAQANGRGVREQVALLLHEALSPKPKAAPKPKSEKATEAA